MYSVNQVNQLYVVGASVVPSGNATTSSPTNEQDLALNYTKDGESLYFKYLGRGGVIATDRIKKCKVKWVSFTSAATMQKKRKVCTITMANGATPIPGKDYIINFNFRNYFGMSDEDQYSKHAVARAETATVNDLYKTLAISLAKNMSREVDWPFTITVGSTTVTPTTKVSDITGTIAGIVLTEEVQPWQLGRMNNHRPEYDVTFVPASVTKSSAVVPDFKWGVATWTETNTNPIKNGRDVADLEWFCMGERGDQYRGKDWPLSINTPAALYANPNSEYDIVVIHFWDDIDNEGPQKSERDMTFVNVAASGANGLSAKMDTLAKTVAAWAGLDTYIKDGVATTTVTTQSSGS